MADAVTLAFGGRRILVVEDEYLLAADLAQMLEELGAVVVGPAATVERALALVEAEDRLDGAVLDLNLGGERAYPVADALVARGVPFVFVTGYDDGVVPAAHAQAPRCEKPFDPAVLARTLSGCIDRRST